MIIARILAIIIFIVMFALIIQDKIERHLITLACGGLTLVLVFGVALRSVSALVATLNIRPIFSMEFWYAHGTASESAGGINWATILFLAGMMIMVEGMGRAGFFRWLCITIAKLVRYKTVPIFLAFMVMSFVLAMFIDSITVILFLAVVTAELAQLLHFDPVLPILAEIFCANLGGSATMCGDPPNIIIGTSLGYSFSDFLTHTGPIAFISLIVIVIYFYLCFRRELKHTQTREVDVSGIPSPRSIIQDMSAFLRSCLIFFCAVVLLITHEQSGLTVATIGIFIAALTLLSAGQKAKDLLISIDYKTLLFFIGLFLVVGGLEQTEVLEIIAEWIGAVSGGNLMVMIAIILWVSAISSAFVDNIPFAATMIPVIKNLSAATGADLSVLAWTLAMGTDIGGSATPIGASANVVGTSISAKKGHPILWGRYCKASVPATIIVLCISMVFIFVRYL